MCDVGPSLYAEGSLRDTFKGHREMNHNSISALSGLSSSNHFSSQNHGIQSCVKTRHCNGSMALLNFTLSEEGVAAFRDALICLNKFSDDVSLEARKDSVRNSQV